VRFVKCADKHLDNRGSGVNKSDLIRTFLRENSERAFYSNKIAEALKEKGVKQRDVMTTLRRAEKKGLVYIRRQSDSF